MSPSLMEWICRVEGVSSFPPRGSFLNLKSLPAREGRSLFQPAAGLKAGSKGWAVWMPSLTDQVPRPLG